MAPWETVTFVSLASQCFPQRTLRFSGNKITVRTSHEIDLLCHLFIVAPLGSISELPAKTCKEIKASEEQAVSKKYWLSTIKPGIPVLAYCDMNTGGKYSRTFPNEYLRTT